MTRRAFSVILYKTKYPLTNQIISGYNYYCVIYNYMFGNVENNEYLRSNF